MTWEYLDNYFPEETTKLLWKDTAKLTKICVKSNANFNIYLKILENFEKTKIKFGIYLACKSTFWVIKTLRDSTEWIWFGRKMVNRVNRVAESEKLRENKFLGPDFPKSRAENSKIQTNPEGSSPSHYAESLNL